MEILKGWTITDIADRWNRPFWSLNRSDHENRRGCHGKLVNSSQSQPVRFHGIPDQHDERQDNCDHAHVVPSATLVSGDQLVDFRNQLLKVVIHVSTVSSGTGLQKVGGNGRRY
jgi:hypothetical protein